MRPRGSALGVTIGRSEHCPARTVHALPISPRSCPSRRAGEMTSETPCAEAGARRRKTTGDVAEIPTAGALEANLDTSVSGIKIPPCTLAHNHGADAEWPDRGRCWAGRSGASAARQLMHGKGQSQAESRGPRLAGFRSRAIRARSGGRSCVSSRLPRWRDCNCANF